MELILEELQKIAQEIRSSTLGFQKRKPGKQYLFVNSSRCQGYLWYFLTPDGEPSGVDYPAIKGYVENLEFISTQRRNKETSKLRITLNCGEAEYILETGAQTQFCKGILAAIAALTPAELMEPLTIAPSAGESENVIFANVYRRGKPVFAPYNDEAGSDRSVTDWRAIAIKAIENVRKVNGD